MPTIMESVIKLHLTNEINDTPPSRLVRKIQDNEETILGTERNSRSFFSSKNHIRFHK